MIASIIKSKTQQANGSVSVVEEHSLNGQSYLHSYLSNDESLIDAVCTERGVQIELELQRRERVLQEATNFEIPLTPVEIMRRLTPAEWQAFQESTNPNIVYFREVFDKTTQIYRNDPLTQAGLQALVMLGILAEGRVSEILA